MPESRSLPPVTTWHSQATFLWIAWTWGLSYVIPPANRISFAEVFPTPAPLPMRVWGILLLLGATVALVAEQLLRHTRFRPWGWAIGGHILLSGIYLTLAACALVEGLQQVGHTPHIFYGVFATLSALSRPVLWGAVGILHTTFARMRPTPELPERGPLP